ncbi:MICOS complex subunit Mic60-like isoform X1 [Argiope bruennichi]|uniref:MICOS complex subunit MIC60 n=1 Tax=Argiope bruennichi TaxID=94029 RepID=A0A8T0F8L9_ARGBR|nr:MICOS complex subunit Mic60-like isoform X1 [Argiope bruennichi]KAF8785750.1 MICOS complex subunit Mic60 like protein [Argiope bruennichi]
MWRSLRLNLPKSKVSSHLKKLKRPYSSSSSSGGGGGGKVVYGVLAAAGAGFAGAVVYGKYDPKFKKVLQDNIPYVDRIYKLFPDEDQKPIVPTKSVSDEKAKEAAMASSLLKRKLDREREKEKAPITEVQKSVDTKSKEIPVQNSNSKIPEPIVKISETSSTAPNIKSVEKQEAEQPSSENLVSDMLKKLEKNSEETKVAYETAVKAVKLHTKSLYEALDLPEGKDRDIVWKEVKKAGSDKSDALKSAEQKASETRVLMEKLKINMKKLTAQDRKNPLIRNAEETLSKVENQLKNAQAEVTSVETEAKTATEYQNLVNASKEQFQKELQIVLPNYVHGGKDKPFSESDLNLLIAHAHRRIEQLQKQLAKQQVTEKIRVDEAVRLQKLKDERFADSKIEAELERRSVDLESAIADRVAHLKEEFENELRQQLRRQAAAHADHIQEVLKVQEQELERKFSLDLEEKLLHQKGVFISEMSGNMSRLKGILAFLKAKSEFDKASKKAQALWLACQAMSHKISADNAGNPSPLGKDIAAVKIAADEESEFINAVLAGIPTEAVNRGVYNNEVLKERFQDVKRVCRKVALVDENNDSLYRYFLSYLQSFLIVDAVSIPKEELEGKVAVDPSEWDTFDILSRVSYCLKINDLEQALRYANQLKGEPRIVAKDWMDEVKLLLETQLAVKALLAHAAAVGVQAYH